MKITIRQASLLIAISLLIMTLAALFAYGIAHSQLVVSENAQETFLNIEKAPSLFLMELAAWVVIIITDLLVSLGFYFLYKPVSIFAARLTALLRLAYTLVLSLGVSRLFSAWYAFSTLEDPERLLTKLADFEMIWSLGLIVFGLHLMVAGFVMLKSKGFPAWLGLLLTFAGLSYTFVHGFYAFGPSFTEMASRLETLLSLPMMLSELSLALWLLVKKNKLTTDHLAIRR